MIVVDTNILGYLFLTSVRSEQAEQAFQKDPEWAVPLLWSSEFRNVLVVYLRKGLLSLEEALEILETALSLTRGREFEIQSLDVFKLAASSTCSAYECEFVALAQDLGVPLVTVDHEILSQFPHTAISLDSFVQS